MRSKSWLKPSPALVIAVIALMISLGGTGYAAFVLGANTVGTKQLKDGAVTGPKVHPHSLLASDFASGQLPRGPRGPQGPAGHNGMNGAPGAGRAYGFIRADGTLVTARSKGIVGNAGHPALGDYCITLAAGIDPSTSAIVATPDESEVTDTSKAVAHVDVSAADCPKGQLEVIMRHFSVDTTVSPPVIADHHVDNGFTFVVP